MNTNIISKYLNKLEFEQIRNIVSSFCTTFAGKNIANNLVPSFNSTDVSKLLKETTEASTLIYRKGNPPISEIEDITIHLKTLNSSFCLSAKYLLDLAHILKTSRELKSYFFSDDSEESNSNVLNIDTSFAVILTRYFENLYSNNQIENNIFSSILDENTISDTASSKLNSIRKDIQNTMQTIKNKLNSFLGSKYLQESIITIRAGRFVLPVKNEYRTEIKGFVHDISASGSTVFIEPLSVFELNNELNNLKNDEQIEIERILQQLSSLFIPIEKELENNINLIGRIDFIFAKAKYSNKISGIEPSINNEKYLSLINAKHPLIDNNIAVANSIYLGKDFTSLIITGPNTGGKTVTLKTVGLLCLMAMSGLHIPANEKSSIFVFDSIYADIGDDQSISDSISTFSSHMKNIIEITKTATENSLVLIDELGSGTDPLEGSSLAISILKFLNDNKILTIATTHYQELKHFALATNGFENASVEFNIETLSPTYKLLIGVPGRSNAFAISEKLGLDKNIIENAKIFLKQDSIPIENIIKSIYDDKAFIESEKEKIEKNSKEIELLKHSLEKDSSDIQNTEKELLKKAKENARDIVLNAKDEVNEIIRKVSNTKDLKELNNYRNKLNKKLENLTSISSENNSVSAKSITKNDITLGMTVFVNTLNTEGIVVSLPSKDNQVQIQVGAVKMYFPINMLSSIKKTSSAKKQNNILENSNRKQFSAKSVKTEINLLGQTVEEAIFVVDKFLDDAVLSALPTVRIIHGKGTGTLKNGIHQFLKKHPHVKSYRLGLYGEGEDGVTIVELK